MQTLIDFPSIQTGSRERHAFTRPCQVLQANALDQIKPLLDQVEALSKQGLWCVGYVRYEAAPAFDAALQVHPSDGPLAWFAVYEQAQSWPQASHQSATAYWQPTLPREAFNQNISKIHAAIEQGQLYQVNYTAPVKAPLQGEPQNLFHALLRAQPSSYAAFIDAGSEQILSVSPELFFDWDGEHILSRPMKGTAPRGATAEHDKKFAQQLEQSAKERAENVMIVDLIRNDLSRIAQPFSVKTPRLFHVEALPTVFQMSSDVTAQTRSSTTLADVFAALFPCGSITGAPKVQAMQMIKELEPGPRGVYCGAIGLVRPGGRATFNVAIRTVTVQGSNASCGVGSGITLDATADDEWNEWLNKCGFLIRAAKPFELLETLRLENGQFHNLEAHLARSRSAATHFSYEFNSVEILKCLENLAQQHPQGAWRVRLLITPQGHAHAQAYELVPTAEPVRLLLADKPFEMAGSEFVRFKTTLRSHYDEFTPTDPKVFDTILYNRHGELTECTRGNIACLIDGTWLTPADRCGLLGGVARERYLREGKIEQGIIRLEDLPRVNAFAFFNSLRGWLTASTAF